MNRIISRGKFTFYTKKVSPILVLGFTGFIILQGFQAIEGISSKIKTIIMLGIIAVLQYFIIKKGSNLIDEVYDEGSTLLFINGGKEIRINLSEIDKVNYYGGRHPRVVIDLRHETELGKELRFIPTSKDDIADLVDRLNKTIG